MIEGNPGSSLRTDVCQRRPNFGSGTVSVRLVGEQDSLAEQVESGAAVHLAFGVS
jgi:hypothetical protein